MGACWLLHLPAAVHCLLPIVLAPHIDAPQPLDSIPLDLREVLSVSLQFHDPRLAAERYDQAFTVVDDLLGGLDKVADDEVAREEALDLLFGFGSCEIKFKS